MGGGLLQELVSLSVPVKKGMKPNVRYRALFWAFGLLVGLPLIVYLWVAIVGWNWARSPLERMVLDHTGRALVIGGNLSVDLGWHAPRVMAKTVTFANPDWAVERHMLAVDEVELTVNVPALFSMKLVFPEVHLMHPVIFLEQANDGRKTWLLDRKQSNEKAIIPIGTLTVGQGLIGYDDVGKKTHLRVDLSTRNLLSDTAAVNHIVFSATGSYLGEAFSAKGNGGPVLGLYDATVPYPLKVEAAIGRTSVQADGTVTGLMKLAGIDMHLALRGDSLAELFPLLGIALPQTKPYDIAGRILQSEKTLKYKNFSGHFGRSDLAGTLQVNLAGPRPFLKGELTSRRLTLADLQPLIGSTEKTAATGSKPVAKAKLLPDIPFKAERWHTVDADVTLSAATLLRAEDVPLDNLEVHLKMINAVLTLEPLDFGFAGGHLKAVISMDGSKSPIQAHASVGVRKVQLDKLFPTIRIAQSNIGEINGQIDLSGHGDSVGRMLATSDGRVGLVIANGEISKLLMEQVGLHLLEILQLSLMGDKTVKLNCGVVDLVVKAGVMEANTMALETEVSTIVGSGRIDLERETLDLTLVPKTRATSPVALRSPIHVKGSFSNPDIQLDTASVAARSIGAVALGLINPLLALIPLVEMGPGVESHCNAMIRSVKMPVSSDSEASSSNTAK